MAKCLVTLYDLKYMSIKYSFPFADCVYRNIGNYWYKMQSPRVGENYAVQLHVKIGIKDQPVFYGVIL